jgi:hypothetical protein
LAFLALLGLWPVLAFAEAGSLPLGYNRIFVGKIGKLELAGLELENGTNAHPDVYITGSYSYAQAPGEIALEGNMDEKGRLSLREYGDPKEPKTMTGTFNGRFKGVDKVSGTWSSANGKRKYPFILQIPPKESIAGDYSAAFGAVNAEASLQLVPLGPKAFRFNVDSGNDTAPFHSCGAKGLARASGASWTAEETEDSGTTVYEFFFPGPGICRLESYPKGKKGVENSSNCDNASPKLDRIYYKDDADIPADLRKAREKALKEE